jgi:hypothetical protein
MLTQLLTSLKTVEAIYQPYAAPTHVAFAMANRHRISPEG